MSTKYNLENHQNLSIEICVYYENHDMSSPQV